jgi:hypothetical protein
VDKRLHWSEKHFLIHNNDSIFYTLHGSVIERTDAMKEQEMEETYPQIHKFL